MNYKHTQKGYLVIVAILFVIGLFAYILANDGYDIFVLCIMFLVILILFSFLSLTVTIDDFKIHIKFGYGIFSKSFLLDEIDSVKSVKNHWYYGWGIRVWFWPKMYIFNISGYYAVELKMKNGKIYRIGTDEPENLENQINNLLK